MEAPKQGGKILVEYIKLDSKNLVYLDKKDPVLQNF